MTSNAWASDVPISLPDSVDTSGRTIPMFGFVFTENGLFHDLNAADHELLNNPTYAPPPEPGRTVYDDGR